MPDERINSVTASNYSITSSLDYLGAKIRVYFNGSCLTVKYELNNNYNISSYPKLENYLFGAVTLTKNVDIDKYKYFGYVIGFDRKGKFSVGNRFRRNFKIFGVDMSLNSSAHVDNNKKDILVLGEGPTQDIHGTILTA